MYSRSSRSPAGNGLTLRLPLRTPYFTANRRSCRQEKAWFGRWRRRQRGSMTAFGIRGRTGTLKGRRWTLWGSNPSRLARGGQSRGSSRFPASNIVSPSVRLHVSLSRRRTCGIMFPIEQSTPFLCALYHLVASKLRYNETFTLLTHSIH